VSTIDPSTYLLPLREPTGGFRSSSKGQVRPDSTGWASLILALSHPNLPSQKQSFDIMSSYQLEDGRISLSPDQPETFWPTSISLLAWQHSVFHQANHDRACHFLLHSSGKHWKKKRTSGSTHDTALRGWAWIDNTHSWIETTALAIIALHNAGFSTHPRLDEATAMILDRQLPKGGWNYGNTIVFGNELRPSPEDTGAALSALSGRVPLQDISRSLDYLMHECSRLRTPIALGWSLLGLNAWEQTPNQAQTWIQETLQRRFRYGGYDTSSLCLLFAPLVAPNGLKNNHVEDRKAPKGLVLDQEIM